MLPPRSLTLFNRPQAQPIPLSLEQNAQHLVQPVVVEELTKIEAKEPVEKSKKVNDNTFQDFLDELRDLVDSFDKEKINDRFVRYDWEVKEEILKLFKKYKF